MKRVNGHRQSPIVSCLIAGSILLLAGCAGLRQMLAGPEQSSYFPLETGNQWEYRLVSTIERNGRLDTTTTAVYLHRVTRSIKLADGQPAFERVWDSRVTLRDSGMADSSFSQAETTWFRRSKHWVYRYLSPRDAPDSILELPPEMDQKWFSAGLYYWVAAREDVNVGGRLYPRCWRVTMTEAQTPNSSNAWFAPGFGLVRMTTERAFESRKLRTDYFLAGATIK